MGTGGSFLHGQDDDDILGMDIDGSSRGVIKRIPIEMKPRGKLGLRSVGSVGRKPKGGSLRSALSVDLENPEVERIRKEFELYRMNRDNEVAGMQRKERKIETENQRLRAELQLLQRTCNNMRQEKEAACDERHQAMYRASAFEQDRDKVQRAFKIFRETKENEIQNLLRAKRDLENKLTKIAHHGFLPEDVDSSSRTGLDNSLGGCKPADWWTALDSEPSMGSTVQLHQTSFRGPEFASSMMECEGPFTNVNKEDWSTALANLSQLVPTSPGLAPSRAIRLYISAPKDAQPEVDTFLKDYQPKLCSLCEAEGRILVVTHMFYDDLDSLPPHVLDHESACRWSRAEQTNIFLAFLGDTTNRFSQLEYSAGHLHNPGAKSAVFCFREVTGSSAEARELRNKVRDSGSAKIIDGYTTASQGTELAYTEVERLLTVELGLDGRRPDGGGDVGEAAAGVWDGGEAVVPGVWDVNCHYEQMEALNYAAHATSELAFEKHYERLNGHVLSAGPLPPLLILSPAGAGRSLLLSKWIQLQAGKCPGSLVLYHLVGSPRSISADPVVMIRRFTAQLMQQVSCPPVLSCDPSRLVEEFPRWLEKVSSRAPGGVILVIDSIDRFQQAEVHLKWLLDPLPVDARVIVSAHDDTCPQPWRSWPTLQVEPLSNKNVKELLRAELATLSSMLNKEEETKVLTHCRNSATCVPLYVMVLARHIAECSQNETKVRNHLDAMLSAADCVSLYVKVLELLRMDMESPESRGFTGTVLRYVYVSRAGLSESELLDLVPGLTWTFLGPLCHVLVDHLVLRYHAGLLMFAHEQVRKAVHDFCFGKEEVKVRAQLRQDLVHYFQAQLSPCKVSCRVTEELPWQLHQADDKENLKCCLLNMFVFQKMYARGLCAELLGYWSFIGADKSSMAQAYIAATRHMDDSVGQYGGQVSLPMVADMYDTLGRFLADLGQLNQALSTFERALEVRETALDPDHPIIAHSLHALAGLHAQLHAHTAAEGLYRQALDIYENALGGEHVLVAREYEALALLYQKQDKHDLADPLRKKAVAIRRGSRIQRVASPRGPGIGALRKRALQLEGLCMGPDSPDLARTLNELAVLNYLQNDFETAESFFKRCLEMREKLLGADHPDLAQALNNLAALYNDRRQYAQAEPLYERALRIRTKHFSPDHASIASVTKHLALLYRRQGKYEQAEPLYKQAVEIRLKSFGPNHPSVATALVNLAVVYSQQNKHSDAEPLYEAALTIYEDSFGPTHPRVAETLRNLAVLKYEQRDYETAARLYKRATEIKDSDATYTGHKDLSRRSSSTDTNSTVKNLHVLHS